MTSLSSDHVSLVWPAIQMNPRRNDSNARARMGSRRWSSLLFSVVSTNEYSPKIFRGHALQHLAERAPFDVLYLLYHSARVAASMPRPPARLPRRRRSAPAHLAGTGRSLPTGAIHADCGGERARKRRLHS